MHRWSILIIVQRDATQSSLFIILQVHFTYFGCQPHPSSGVHKTVNTASNVPKLVWPHWREAAAQKTWPVPEAAVRVLCTPYDGCGWHPKYVEWTCRIINRLLCVASRWTIINIVFYALFLTLAKSEKHHVPRRTIGLAKEQHILSTVKRIFFPVFLNTPFFLKKWGAP